MYGDVAIATAEKGDKLKNNPTWMGYKLDKLHRYLQDSELEAGFKRYYAILDGSN